MVNAATIIEHRGAVTRFLNGTREVQFELTGKDSKRYGFVTAVVKRLRYRRLARARRAHAILRRGQVHLAPEQSEGCRCPADLLVPTSPCAFIHKRLANPS